jgi:excisionase family DNA binding protein
VSEPVDVGPEVLDLLTVDEVAARLRLSPKTIRQLIWKEELEAVRIGRAVRIAPEAVAEYKKRLRARAGAA